MYFTRLPDHSKSGFAEKAHFNIFKQSNVVFNATSSNSSCDYHIRCLSFKTVLSGEEWYGVDRHQIAVRPGQFLILNGDQSYSSSIDHEEKVRTLSIFFKSEFASCVFHDAVNGEKALLDHPFNTSDPLEFYQTLYEISSELQTRLLRIVNIINHLGAEPRGIFWNNFLSSHQGAGN
jgi:AraC family transcriptional regulator